MQKWDINETISNRVKLHANLLDILFKHRTEILLRLSDIRGLLQIDHISMNIINSDNQLAIFSSTPSVEFNLVMQGLWQYDKSFFPILFENGSLLWWEEAYLIDYKKILKKIKEEKHGYTLGFGIARKYKNLNLVYSYATRSRDKNLKSYFECYRKDLQMLGDYAFKRLYDIYLAYDHTAPPIDKGSFEKNHLKLVVNKG